MARSRSIKVVGVALLVLAVLGILLSQLFTITITREVRLVGASELLMNAIYNGRPLPEINALLEAHPQWAHEPIYQDFYAIHFAAQSGRNDVIELLISHGVDVNQRGGFLNATPLVSAVESRNAETVALLLDHGADPHASMTDGRSSLEYARETGTEEIRQLFDRRTGAMSGP